MDDTQSVGLWVRVLFRNKEQEKGADLEGKMSFGHLEFETLEGHLRADIQGSEA